MRNQTLSLHFVFERKFKTKVVFVLYSRCKDVLKKMFCRCSRVFTKYKNAKASYRLDCKEIAFTDIYYILTLLAEQY